MRGDIGVAGLIRRHACRLPRQRRTIAVQRRAIERDENHGAGEPRALVPIGEALRSCEADQIHRRKIREVGCSLCDPTLGPTHFVDFPPVRRC